MVKQIRHTETKSNIKKALTELLSQKSFEKISVTTICCTAGINRGTFYLHYKDKYDMMEKIKEETLTKLYAIITQESKTFNKKVVCETIDYLHQNMDFFEVMAKTSYAKLPQITRNFVSYILDNIPNSSDHITKKMGVPVNYARIAYVASIEAVMTEWILSGGKESPEEMTEIILQIGS